MLTRLSESGILPRRSVKAVLRREYRGAVLMRDLTSSWSES